MPGFKSGWFATSLALLVALFLIVPIVVVLPVSFTDQRFLSFPQEQLSLQYFRQLISDPAWLDAFRQSLVIALGSLALAVPLGTLFSIGCWRISNKSVNVLRALMLVPLVIPPVVYGVGLFRQFAMIGLLDTFAGVIIAHAVTGLPYVVVTVSASLSSFDPRLEQAAQGLGASYPQILRHVIVPRIMPGIFSGSILVFIHSWDELVIAMFISARAVYTLPRKIWSGINETVDPTIAAVAVVVIIFTVVLLFIDIAMRGKDQASS